MHWLRPHVPDAGIDRILVCPGIHSVLTALFSLLGTLYGGNGQTTFALPDLRGRSALGAGQGPGLSSYDQGEQGGVESVTLTAQEVAPHVHAVAGATDATAKAPTGALPGYTADGASYSATASVVMNPGMDCQSSRAVMSARRESTRLPLKTSSEP